MKTTYIKPEIKVVEIGTQAILADSLEFDVYRDIVSLWADEEL